MSFFSPRGGGIWILCEVCLTRISGMEETEEDIMTGIRMIGDLEDAGDSPQDSPCRLVPDHKVKK